MDLARFIDHTVLKPDTTLQDIIKTCDEAKEYGFFSVCVNPYYVARVASELRGTAVKVTAVIGFPLGANSSYVKGIETEQAINDGANEIDMVINVAALKNKDYAYVENDIRTVVNALKGKAILKVILETCLLDPSEKRIACELAKKAGAHFVKTSTGFSTGGATVEDIKLMKEVVGDALEVKASGAVRDYDTAIKMINAGATRIGTSSSVAIVRGELTNESGY